MDTASPHNIMLMQVSAEEYENELLINGAVMVAPFGYLMKNAFPIKDDMDREVHWLYVCIGKNHYRGVFRMSIEEFRNIRQWQFMRDATDDHGNVAPLRKRRSS